MRDETSLTDQLAATWAGMRYEDLPQEVIEAAKLALMDTLSVAVRGAEAEVAQIALRGAQALAETNAGSAHVWGAATTLPPAAAAMVNGTAAHAYEFDDYGGCGHSGAVVVPAVCALADREGADGRAVLLALAAGYDIAARITEGAGGYRAHNDLGWHSTGTCGTFGAAAGAASILRLDATAYRSALGIAGSFAGGTWAFLVDGAMTKKFHPGRAAENGVSAAVLAAAGMEGPRYILDAKWGGFFATYCRDTATPEATVQRLGEEFRIFSRGVKPYPCCRGLHSSIEALIDVLNESATAPDDIDQIVIHGADRTVRQFRNYDVATILDGQFSLPYALASVADRGEATMDEFFPLRTDQPRVQALMAKVEVLADRPLGAWDEPDLELRRRDGAVFHKHVPVPKGAATRPLDAAFLLRKHETTAIPAIGRRRFDALRTAIDRLETLPDFRAISRILAA